MKNVTIPAGAVDEWKRHVASIESRIAAAKASITELE